MSVATHNSDIAVDFQIIDQDLAVKGFSSVLLIVPLSDNSLNGDRVRTYTSVTDAQDDEDLGYISASTLAAVTVGFSQSKVPQKIKVGYYNDAADVPAVAATKDFSTVSPGAYDSTIHAATAGAAGNNIEVQLVPDSASGVSIQVLPLTNGGYAVLIHFQGGTSTVTNVNSAIAALTGANAVITASGGTGATVLTTSDGAHSNLAGGSDAVPTETYGQGYDACAAYDPDFYGVCATSRTPADQLSLANAIAASSSALTGQRIAILQSSDSTLLTNTPGSDLTSILAIGRASIWYHTTDTEWADMAIACFRLAFDPDTISAPFYGSVAAVAAYTSDLTSTQTGFLDTNNVNWMGPIEGGGDYYFNRGVNGKGEQISQYVTADWFTARLTELVGTTVTALVNSGQKVPLNTAGQAMMVNLAISIWNTGAGIGHFTGAALFKSPTLTPTDISLRRIIVNGATQFLSSAYKFIFNVTGSTTAVSTS